MGGETFTYAYNSDGLLASVTSTNGSGTELTYDYFNRLSAQKDYAAGNKYLFRTFSYSNGNVSQVSYTSDMGGIGTEQYTYTNGTLTKVRFAGQDVWELDAENSLGQTTSVSSGPLTRSVAYDTDGLLTGISVDNGNGTLQSFGYSFDGAKGNLSWRKDLGRNLQESFSYDYLNRLNSAPGTFLTYSDNGNITYKLDIRADFLYEDATRPYAITGMSSYWSVLPTASQAITYNACGRPLTISEGGDSLSFAYDAGGSRCRMAVLHGDTLLRTRYYSGERLEEDVTPSGTTARFYVGGDAYTAPAVYIYNGSSWSLHYIGRDHLGSITLITSSSGTAEYEYSYDAWGRLRNPQNQQVYALGQEPALFLSRGYCGHEHLQQFGLVNMNARLYDPLTGRFLSPDPYVQMPDFTQSLNRYTYCLNNPLKYVDKDGELWWVIVGAVVGAYIGGSVTNHCEWNPVKWDYNAPKTYVGMVVGGVVGGYGGYLYESGAIGLELNIITPLGTLGASLWKGNDDKNRSEGTITTPDGRKYFSTDSFIAQKVNDTYNSAVEQFKEGNRVARNINSGVNSMSRWATDYSNDLSLKQNSLQLKNRSNQLGIFIDASDLAVRGLSKGYYDREDMREAFVRIGSDIGSYLGGAAVGLTAAGFSIETGPGALFAGALGVYAGSQIGGVMGSIMGESAFNVIVYYYDKYYAPARRIIDYTEYINSYYGSQLRYY